MVCTPNFSAWKNNATSLSSYKFPLSQSQYNSTKNNTEKMHVILAAAIFTLFIIPSWANLSGLYQNIVPGPLNLNIYGNVSAVVQSQSQNEYVVVYHFSHNTKWECLTDFSVVAMDDGGYIAVLVARNPDSGNITYIYIYFSRFICSNPCVRIIFM